MNDLNLKKSNRKESLEITIESRKGLLVFQAFICFFLGFVVLWITTLRPVVTFSTEDISPILFNLIRFGVVLLLVLWGIFFVIKSLRYQIELYSTYLKIRTFTRTQEISYQRITGFIWEKGTARFAAIFPFVKMKLCTITGKNGYPFVTLSTLDFKDLEVGLNDLEVKLADESLL